MSIYTFNHPRDSMMSPSLSHYRSMGTPVLSATPRGKHPLRQVITANSQASMQSSPVSATPDAEDETWRDLVTRVERMKHAVAVANSESDHHRSGTVTPSVVASRLPDPYASPEQMSDRNMTGYHRSSASELMPNCSCNAYGTYQRALNHQFGHSHTASMVNEPRKVAASMTGHYPMHAANNHHTRHIRTNSSKSHIYPSRSMRTNGMPSEPSFYASGAPQRRHSQYVVVPPALLQQHEAYSSPNPKLTYDRHGRLMHAPVYSCAQDRRHLPRALPLEVFRLIANYLSSDAYSTIVSFARVSRACYAAAVSDGGLRERVYRGRYLSCGGAGAGAGEVESDFLRWELRRMYGDRSNLFSVDSNDTAITDKTNPFKPVSALKGNNGTLPNGSCNPRHTASMIMQMADINDMHSSRKVPASKAISREQWMRQVDWTRVNRHRSRLEKRWRDGNYTRRDVPLPGVYSGNGHEGHSVRVLAGCAWGAILETNNYTNSDNRQRRVIVIENKPVIRAERDPRAGMTRIRHRVQPQAHELQVKAAETGSGIGLTFTGVADVRLNDRYIVILAGFVSEFGTQRHALCVRSTSDLAGENSLARVRVWMPPGRNLRMLSGRWLLVHRWAFDQDTCSVYDLARGLRLVGQLHAPVRTSCLQAQDERAAVMYLGEVRGPRRQLCWRQVVLKSDTNSSSGTSNTSLNANEAADDASFSSSTTVVTVASPTSSSSSRTDTFNSRTVDNKSQSTSTTTTYADDLSTLGQRQSLQGELAIEGVDPQSLRVIPVDRNRVLLQYQLEGQDSEYQFALHDTTTNKIVWQLAQPALAVRVHPLPAASAISVRDADPNSLNGSSDSEADSLTASEAGRMRMASQRCLVIRLSDGHLLHQRHWPWQITNSCSGLNAINSTTDTQPDATRMAVGSIGCAANADGRWCRIDLKDGEPLGWLEDGFSVERVRRRPDSAGPGRRSPAASDADIGEGCVVTSTYFGYVEQFTGLFVMLDFSSSS
ncbi:hypothetical protein BDF19DRAFT_419821 [Syncephalis fuscata]|nr:hypothetical protein BDF19DRAFT_419821 [Syncephalis fuscata]